MINWKRVGELRDDIGADDFEEVVELFLEEVAEVVTRLKDTPEPDRFEADLHFLKGSALNLGFGNLGAVCADGERLARRGDSGSVDIATVIDVFYASMAEFTEGLERQKAA